MSCIWSLPTGLLATKTSKLEKKEVPGRINTTPIKPRGNSSTVGLFSLLTESVGEEATTGDGSIGSKSFAGPPAAEVPAPSTTDEGGGTICEPFPDNEPKRPPAPELPATSTDGGGGMTSESEPESKPNFVPRAGPLEP